MRAKRKNVRERTELLNEGAQMSNELESERAMVVIELWWKTSGDSDLELLVERRPDTGVWRPYYGHCTTGTRGRAGLTPEGELGRVPLRVA